MPTYHYTARITATREETSGDLSTESVVALGRRLRAEGKELLVAKAASGVSDLSMDRINMLFSRIALHDKILFARNLATMLQSGLPLSRSLSILLKQATNLRMKIVLKDLLEDIEKGTPLSDAMGRHPEAFPDVLIAMTRAGEESGGLVEALNTVGNQLEKSYSLRKRVRGALIYPVIVLSVMIVVSILMIIYVVPGLSAAFVEANITLPIATRIFIGLSNFFTQHGVLAFSTLVGFIAGVILFLRTEIGKRTADYLSIHFPIFGKLVREYNTAIITQTLAALISAGVDIVRAIDITHGVIGNGIYQRTLIEAKEGIQKGHPISAVFAAHLDAYPVMTGDMIEVGEETGQLSDMLKKVATFYESEVDAATTDMSKLIEPFLMLFIAGGVGLFAVAMITPMYSLTTAM